MIDIVRRGREIAKDGICDGCVEAVDVLRELADEVERLREFKPKGGQHVGPSVGPIARLKQENRDLKYEVERLTKAYIADCKKDELK